jgi:hypothetical protein
MVEVTTGVAQNDFVEVNFGGMNENIQVVKDGAFDLLSAMKNGGEED